LLHNNHTTEAGSYLDSKLSRNDNGKVEIDCEDVDDNSEEDRVDGIERKATLINDDQEEILDEVEVIDTCVKTLP